jgi:hypothetical protein
MVRPGYRWKSGKPTREPVVSVLVLEKVKPNELAAKARLPKRLDGVPVDVRPASLAEQIAAWEASGARQPARDAGLALANMAEARGAVMTRPPHQTEGEDMMLRADGASLAVVPYRPPATPLKAIEAEMTILLNSGPDSGWRHLKAFFGRTEKRLVATMYEFNARHIYEALRAALPSPRKLHLVMDWEADGDWDNDEIADLLRADLGNRFQFAWAAVQSDNVTTDSWISHSYHIKVAVRDGKELWLSSGNWKSSSQPEKDPSELTTLAQKRALQSKGNRDWHVIVDNEALAKLFEIYVKHDLKQASAVQRTQTAAVRRRGRPDIWVPLGELAALEVETPQFFPAKQITGRIKVQPLLTPDNFIDYVQPLVESATTRLYLENQALKGGAPGTLLGKLHRTIAAKTRTLEDVKIILRGEYDMAGMFEALQAADADMTKVRFLRGVHTKGIIVDDEAVVVGSHNLTGAGITTNRDASLIIYNQEAIAFYERLFLYDWGRAKPGRARAERNARLATPGEPPPPGFVRVRWSDHVDA